MVLRDSPHLDPAKSLPFRLRIDGRWIFVDEKLLRAHPGGGAMLAYRNLDATSVGFKPDHHSTTMGPPSSPRHATSISINKLFHAFHANSKKAYTWLRECRKKWKEDGETDESKREIGQEDVWNIEPQFEMERRLATVNMGRFEINAEKNTKICQSFAQLRYRVREQCLLDGDNRFFARKFAEAIGIICLSLFFQWIGQFMISALLMGLAWQQLGWMIHEYGHQQHFRNRQWNDICGYVCGNLLQGFSLGGWKEQHNVHHAATNIDGRDGDLDLLPLWATIGSHLMQVDSQSFFARLLPFQHLYWSLALPMLRLSWLLQSIQFVSQMHRSFYDIHRQKALIEQSTLTIHWALVFIQYYLMPDNKIRIQYFLISQLFAGFLLAHVVTYNHYSTEKFSHNDPILGNYACLQLYTTRNMRPGLLIDWLWGGLNYQIEHHLFPTMPRHNLKKVMPMVKAFCAENDLPYMVDDYFTGFWLTIDQLRKVAEIAADTLQSGKFNNRSNRKEETNDKFN